MERTLHIDQYYTSMEHLVKVYEKKGRRNKFCAQNLEEYGLWKKETRVLLKELLGLEEMETCELMAQVTEHVELEKVIREKVLIQVEPEVWMPLYVLIPKTLNEKVTCIIAPHGHQGGGKLSVAGREDIPAIKDKIEFYNYDYGMKLAEQGFVVFCPDARGYGERREKAFQSDEEQQFLRSTCAHLSHMALPLGQTVIGMYTWDLMRLIDYIETKWQYEALGCVGFSGGGMQALWLSALEDRIDFTVISGYLYGYKEALLKLPGNCSCNYVPRLWQHLDMGDIAALIAPRPLYIQTGRADHLNGERGVLNAIEQVDVIKSAYALFNEEEKVKHEIHEGPHRWYGEAVYDYLQQMK